MTWDVRKHTPFFRNEKKKNSFLYFTVFFLSNIIDFKVFFFLCVTACVASTCVPSFIIMDILYWMNCVWIGHKNETEQKCSINRLTVRKAHKFPATTTTTNIFQACSVTLDSMHAPVCLCVSMQKFAWILISAWATMWWIYRIMKIESERTWCARMKVIKSQWFSLFPFLVPWFPSNEEIGHIKDS